MDLCDRSATELAAMLRAREVSSREITKSVFGRLDQLPYDHGEGVLEVRLPVTQARLEYHPGWSAITDLDAHYWIIIYPRGRLF